MTGGPAGTARARLGSLAVAIAVLASHRAAAAAAPDGAAPFDEAICSDALPPTLYVPAGIEWAQEPVESRAQLAATALCRVLETRPGEPWSIRLHADVESFLRANPLAAEVGGVIGGSRRSPYRADLIVPARPEAGVAWDTAVRREVGRLLVLSRAGPDLPDVWVDATADYLAGRSLDRAAGVARLRQAWSDGRLPTWSAVSANDGSYVDPPVVRPMALAALHFLTERHGFEQWLGILDAVAAGRPFEAAAQSVLGADLELLDAEWRSWLPGYLDGGWQAHALYDPDLASARALAEQGRGALAVRRLEMALPLAELDDPAAAKAIEAVLTKARTAESQAGALAESVAALADGDYVRAQSLAAGVADDGAALAGRRSLAHELTERARLGREALDRSRAASILPSWRALQARALASSAAADLERLGNDAAAKEALAAVDAANARLRPAGAALISVGLVALVRNVVRRRRSRGSP